jgi:hypothetical protein
MADLPPESEKLLAVSPEDFVAERKQLVGQLRDQGRPADADAVAGLRKPSAVVLAVNRAARDRPKAAEAAAMSAGKVEDAQAKGDLEAYRAAMGELDRALDLVGEVAVAHLGAGGKKATESMRRRAHDLIRRSVATEEGRAALRRGVLLEEQEAAGFVPIAGLASSAKRRTSRQPAEKDTRAERESAKRRERQRQLRGELTAAEEALEAAEKAVRAAERERKRAERAVASARAKLDRLG